MAIKLTTTCACDPDTYSFNSASKSKCTAVSILKRVIISTGSIRLSSYVVDNSTNEHLSISYLFSSNFRVIETFSTN